MNAPVRSLVDVTVLAWPLPVRVLSDSSAVSPELSDNDSRAIARATRILKNETLITPVRFLCTAVGDDALRSGRPVNCQVNDVEPDIIDALCPTLVGSGLESTSRMTRDQKVGGLRLSASRLPNCLVTRRF